MLDKWWKISKILVKNGRKGKECVARIKELPEGPLVVVHQREWRRITESLCAT